ncbi:ankyrin repeat domain-containing protein [Paraflavitalea soli]|uniref:Ankyrin repeat domain-containing protein n=1 Tax=Paraflavitalea soli TaxID=2315862 RepID=A0A3B7MM97_9BACT|nr:ankyrin repeat domain-containing protein [Paraflavitalea soli]AXY72735.1 ankyrin repeat domain-containing protein [Paraflavitalea soli]
MKRLLTLLFVGVSLLTQAQNNTLLDQAFWKTNPDLATVKAAVEKGNSPSELNRSSFDPVVYAINANASTEVITFLLEQKGNEPNKITHDSRTYIFWSAARGNLPVVEYLISKGAKLDLVDSHGSTALGFAANAGQANTKVYDALVSAGADIKQKNQEGASLLLTAIANDKDQVLTNYFIAKGLSLQDTDAAGNTAFNYVARSGNIDLMKSLLQKGVKYTDQAFLMAAQGRGAAGSGNGMPVYQYLESLKLKPAVVNKNGENLLHYLARKPNQQEVISYFISRGVNINQADNEGNTPFMNAAASNKDTATLALLLPAKSINLANKKGLTALAMAVRSNSPGIVQYLVNKGADLNAVDAAGNNLAFYLIQSYNGQGPAQEAFNAKMKVLQQAGFSLTTPQKDGNTLYHLAIAKGDIALLKKIETLQVDVNAKNKEGLTVLHKAAMLSKDDSILKYLLSIGAKKEATTAFEETAWQLAKENEFLTKSHVSIDFLK